LIYSRDTSFDGAWGKGFGDGTTRDDYDWGEAGGKWQSSYTNNLVLYSVIWENDQYEEDFTDDTLIDTGSSTATIDTTVDFDVTFGASKTLILGPCHLRVSGTDSSPSNITAVTIIVPPAQLTGSFTTVEVKSSSGGSWETVTGDTTAVGGAYHTFTTPGIAVYLRFTATSAVLSGKNADGEITTAVYAIVEATS
jgi:hypothetical protein